MRLFHPSERPLVVRHGPHGRLQRPTAHFDYLTVPIAAPRFCGLSYVDRIYGPTGMELLCWSKFPGKPQERYREYQAEQSHWYALCIAIDSRV
jgi:hypothetical protein